MRGRLLFLALPVWVMSLRRRVRFRTILLCGLLTALSSRHLPAAIVTLADGDVAGLIAAINAANTNHESDVINLAANGTYTLTAANNATNGGNGLPVVLDDVIGPDLTIHGNGATIQRSANAPSFRFLQVNASVTLDNITFKGGSSPELGGAIRVSATAWGAERSSTCKTRTSSSVIASSLRTSSVIRSAITSGTSRAAPF
jgi:hypothetical protein